MEFAFGMAVLGTDGDEAGTLERVLVDPATREVTHVVVRSPRVSADVLLPLSLVQGNACGGLLLHTASRELESMPSYFVGRIGKPPAERVDVTTVHEPADRRASLEASLSIPLEVREYGPDTRVTTADGFEGYLLSVLSDDFANRLSELRVGGLRGRGLVIPERWVAELHADRVSLSTTSDQLDQIPVGPQAAPYIAIESGPPHEVTERSHHRG